MIILKISMLPNADADTKINNCNIADRKENTCDKYIAVIIPHLQSSAAGKNNYEIGIHNLMKAVYEYI